MQTANVTLVNSDLEPKNSEVVDTGVVDTEVRELALIPSEVVDLRPRGPLGELIPEPWEFRPSPRRKLTSLDRFPSLTHLWPGLLFLVAAFAVSVFGWNFEADFSVSGKGVFESGHFANLFTALLAHGSIEHFLSNALPLIFFSYLLKGYFGTWFFPLGVVGLGALSNLVTVALYDPSTHLLGASGMVYAMVALWLVLFLRFSREKKLSIKMVRALGFAMLLLLPTQYEPNVSYLAHASGFALGVGGGLVALPYVKPIR
jgi:membrane associated rhomboid family serine protease